MRSPTAGNRGCVNNTLTQGTAREEQIARTPTNKIAEDLKGKEKAKRAKTKEAGHNPHHQEEKVKQKETRAKEEEKETPKEKVKEKVKTYVINEENPHQASQINPYARGL